MIKTSKIPYTTISYCESLELNNKIFGLITLKPPIDEYKWLCEVRTKDVKRIYFAFITIQERVDFISQIHQNAFFSHNEIDSKVFAFKFRGPTNQNEYNCSEWTFEPQQEFDRIVPPTLKKDLILKKQVDFSICPSYPINYLIFPQDVSEEDIYNSSSFRTSGRLPVITWIQPTNWSTLSRSSQPRTALRNNRNEGDEKLIQAIWKINPSYVVSESLEDDEKMKIVDARSLTAARANLVRGGGYEATQYYGKCNMEFCNMENIHAIRKSYVAFSDLCCRPQLPEQSDLDSTLWLSHLQTLLVTSNMIVRHMMAGKSVHIHCSDGWDRTTQLSAMAQLLMDPYFRTARGFCLLIQKEWILFGHKFRDRLGFGFSSEQSSEASPIFMQWMDAVSQCISQFPDWFEFTEYFLIKILDATLDARFGTFLSNNETEYHKKNKNTFSFWSFIESVWNKGSAKLINQQYKPNGPPVLQITTASSQIHVWDAYYYRYNINLAVSQLQRHVHFANPKILQTLQDLNSKLDLQINEKNLWKAIAQSAIYEKQDNGLSQDLVELNHFLNTQSNSEIEMQCVISNGKIVRCNFKPCFTVSKFVPSLTSVTKEDYNPCPSSKFKPLTINGFQSINTIISPPKDKFNKFSQKIISPTFEAINFLKNINWLSWWPFS